LKNLQEALESQKYENYKGIKTSTGNKVKLTHTVHKEWIIHFRNLLERRRPQFMEKLNR
jgi:hypothetical protein